MLYYIIICKGIVINLYDIAIAINFSIITSRAVRASLYSMYDTCNAYECMYTGGVCCVKCINVQKLYDLIYKLLL